MLGVIDQVTVHCEELVVLFTNGAKQIAPPTILAVLFEPIRFGRARINKNPATGSRCNGCVVRATSLTIE